MKNKKMYSMVQNAEKASIAKAVPYYPTVSIDTKQFPVAKNWNVGKKYTIVMEVEMTGIHQYPNGQGNAEFRMLKVGECK